jgi:hypothetical protein
VSRRIWILAVVLLSPGARAADTGFLPPAHGLFKPLLADPRELQYAVRSVFPVTQRKLGEAAIGDYFGIYRWSLGDAGDCQVSGGGGVFGRFDLAGTTNDLQVADFYGNVPFDYRRRNFSARFIMFHTSSHLGDDFLKNAGIQTTKHTWDNMRLIGSYEVDSWGRFYAGFTYVFRTNPEHIGRNALQTGFETYSPWNTRVKSFAFQSYWANDFQSWERVGWNGMFNSQLGIRMRKDPAAARGVSIFAEYFTGPQPQGQFYTSHETHWGLGIRFDLS